MSAEIFDCEQGSEEWATLRLGIATASEFKNVMAKGEGKTRKTLMMKLLGERFCGVPADSHFDANMERGKAMEADAREMFSFMEEVELKQVGFIRNGTVGCSPDSLVGNNGMLEVKTAFAHIQIERIFADRLPPEHAAQVQGAMWVAEREFCWFVSYWPRLPLFAKKIYRDDAYIANLAKEIEQFNEELDRLTEKLIASGATRADLPVPKNVLVAV